MGPRTGVERAGGQPVSRSLCYATGASLDARPVYLCGRVLRREGGKRGACPADEPIDGSSGRAWRCDDRSARHRGGAAGVGLAIRVETYAFGVERCGYIL